MATLMLPTPRQWAERLRTLVKGQGWERLYELDVRIDQGFADRRDWDGLEKFYTEGLAAAVEPAVVQQARVKSTKPFEEGMVELLRTGVQRAGADPTILGLYFEYYFDGRPDTGVVDLFPCRAYSEEDDYWGAEFVGNEIVSGPSAFEYLNFDPELDLDPLPSSAAGRYVFGHLLAAFGRAVDRVEGLRWPVGFCAHESRIIRIRPR